MAKYRKNKYKNQINNIKGIHILIAAVLITIICFFTRTIQIKYMLSMWIFVLLINATEWYMNYKEKRKYIHLTQTQIDILEGKNFEKYLKVHFMELGYKVRLTPDSNDYGADLIISNHTEKVVVQAKRYREKVGIKAIQEVVGAIHYYNADRAMVVTNSFFTPNAKNLAEKCNVEIWDRNMLKKQFKIK